MKVIGLMVDFLKIVKLRLLSIEFYGNGNFLDDWTIRIVI